MTFESGLLAFLTTVGFGILGASLQTAGIYAVVGLIGNADLGAAILFGGIALFGAVPVALVVVPLAGLFLGLPLTVLLKKLGTETQLGYAAGGGVAGFVLALVVYAAVLPAPIFSAAMPIGAITGALMGRMWWRTYRRHVVATSGAQMSSTRR